MNGTRVCGNVLSVVNISHYVTDCDSLTPRCFHFALTHSVSISPAVSQTEMRWHKSLNVNSLTLGCVGGG